MKIRCKIQDIKGVFRKKIVGGGTETLNKKVVKLLLLFNPDLNLKNWSNLLNTHGN